MYYSWSLSMKQAETWISMFNLLVIWWVRETHSVSLKSVMLFLESYRVPDRDISTSVTSIKQLEICYTQMHPTGSKHVAFQHAYIHSSQKLCVTANAYSTSFCSLPHFFHFPSLEWSPYHRSLLNRTIWLHEQHANVVCSIGPAYDLDHNTSSFSVFLSVIGVRRIITIKDHTHLFTFICQRPFHEENRNFYFVLRHRLPVFQIDSCLESYYEYR